MNASPIIASRDIPGWLLYIMKEYRITLTVCLLSLLCTVDPVIARTATWEITNPASLTMWLSHLTHWSKGHMVWDLLVFSILAGILERSSRRLLIAILIAAPPVIIICVMLSGVHVSYRGLSGLDSALYGSAIVLLARSGCIGKVTTWTALGLFAGKSALEILSGSALFVSDLPNGVSSVPWAHLSGLASGLLIYWIIPARHWASQPGPWQSPLRDSHSP